jgi:hypothetical protein
MEFLNEVKQSNDVGKKLKFKEIFSGYAYSQPIQEEVLIESNSKFWNMLKNFLIKYDYRVIEIYYFYKGKKGVDIQCNNTGDIIYGINSSQKITSENQFEKMIIGEKDFHRKSMSIAKSFGDELQGFYNVTQENTLYVIGYKDKWSFDTTVLDNNLLRNNNYKFISYSQYGEEKEFDELVCIFSKERIRKINEWSGEFSGQPHLHHFTVSNNSSVHKRDKEPSQLLGESFILSSEDLYEMTCTILLSSHNHDYIHGAGAELDYRMFNKEDAPYCLRSEENWIDTWENWGKTPPISYDDHLKSMINNKMPKKYIKKDWV